MQESFLRCQGTMLGILKPPVPGTSGERSMYPAFFPLVSVQAQIKPETCCAHVEIVRAYVIRPIMCVCAHYTSHWQTGRRNVTVLVVHIQPTGLHAHHLSRVTYK